MTENCTIYCKSKNLAEAARLVQKSFPNEGSISADEEWNSIIAHGDDGSIRISAKWFHERGDDFCRLLLSTRAYVESVANGGSANNKEVMARIVASQVIFGVVAEPTFDSDERYHAIVFSIAKSLDGVIFNGQEILDAVGTTLATSH